MLRPLLRKSGYASTDRPHSLFSLALSLSICLCVPPSSCLISSGLKGWRVCTPLVRVVEFNMQLLSLFSYWETIACVGARPDRNISVSAGNAIESRKAIYHGSARPLRLYFLLF